MMNRQLDDVKIGIITALSKEYAACLTILEEAEEVFFNQKGAGNRFAVGRIKAANGGWHKVALGMSGMGNNKAAIRVSDMLHHFKNINSIIMVGIAGGVPSPDNIDEHVRLGDVVVSESVIQYDFVKETDEGSTCRAIPTLPSARLVEAVKYIEVEEYQNIFNWKKYIDNNKNKIFKKPSVEDVLHDEEGNIITHPIDKSRDKYPKVFSGNIASANILQKSNLKRRELKDKYGAMAVEMEASGVTDATIDKENGYLIVRGICDYCDKFKNNDWQQYAAYVAACYTRDLIEHLPAF